MPDVEQSVSKKPRNHSLSPYALKYSQTRILSNLTVWTVLCKAADGISAHLRKKKKEYKKNKQANPAMLIVKHTELLD